MNLITEAFSRGKYTLEVFVDLSRTFDAANRNILLEKLKVLPRPYSRSKKCPVMGHCPSCVFFRKKKKEKKA